VQQQQSLSFRPSHSSSIVSSTLPYSKETMRSKIFTAIKSAGYFIGPGDVYGKPCPAIYLYYVYDYIRICVYTHTCLLIFIHIHL
jgi:hypothetical protein